VRDIISTQVTSHLYLHRRPDDHGLLQQVPVELGRVVVEVQHGDEDLRQAVLPLGVLRLHVEVVLGAHLRVQTGPRLRVDDS